MYLKFNTDDVARCLSHALESKDWSMGHEEITPKPALLLVHDDGVYLMSNGLPRDFVQEKNRCYVAYAENCNPDKDEDYYENSRYLVGGDDFSEVIPVENWGELLPKFKEIHFEVSDEEIGIFFAGPIEP